MADPQSLAKALRGTGVSAGTQAAINRLDMSQTGQIPQQPVQTPQTPQVPVQGGPSMPADAMARIQAIEAQRQQAQLARILAEREAIRRQAMQPEAPDPYAAQFTQGVRPF